MDDQQFTITLAFTDPDDLGQALAYLGDSQAPVFLTDGQVRIGQQTYPLWNDYQAALAQTKLF